MIEDSHKALLKAFRDQHAKLQWRGPNTGKKGSKKARRLENHRDSFKFWFQRILLKDDEDFELFSPEENLKLDKTLHQLFRLLNDISNGDLVNSPMSLASPTTDFASSETYPRLRKVLSHVENSCDMFQVTSKSKVSLLKLDSLRDAQEACSLVGQLDRLLARAPPAPPDHVEDEPDKTRPSRTLALATTNTKIQSLDNRYRRLMEKVLDTLKLQFINCDKENGSRNGESHKIMLRLNEVSTSNDRPIHALDILVYCPVQGEWQNAQCRFDREPHETNESPPKLCQRLKAFRRRQEGPILLFDSKQNVLRAGRDGMALIPTKDQSLKSLSELMRGHDAFSVKSLSKVKRFKHHYRRSLAAKLALNLFLFCDWRHTSKSWSGDDISFLVTPETDRSSDMPHITCLIGQNSSDHFYLNPTGDETPRCFVEFAKLLLEIEYGPQSSDDIVEIHKEKKEYGEYGKESYLKAVEQCLRFDLIYDDERSTALGKLENPEITKRRLIYDGILCPIVAGLPASTKSSKKRPWEEGIALSSGDEERTDEASTNGAASAHYRQQKLADRTIRPKRVKISSITLPASTESRENGYLPIPQANCWDRDGDLTETMIQSQRGNATGITPSESVPLVEGLSRINTGSLFDGQSSMVRPKEADFSAKWFETLESKVHGLILEARYARDKVVKVAVLDTGLDDKHERIQKHLKKNGSKIVEYLDFTSSEFRELTPSDTPPLEADVTKDIVGHGTAVCDILLRIAKVHLYVAKVTDTVKLGDKSAKTIEQALLHATGKKKSEWDVDIVILAMGFERTDGELRKAIQLAGNKDKIIFAAASNSGSLVPRDGVSFPASLGNPVLSIRSSAKARLADSSPVPSTGDNNFAIQGEGIEVAWSSYGSHEPNPTRFVSGTSYAVSVAAGIAALVLEYANQRDRNGPRLEEKDCTKLRSYHGLQKIFLRMSDDPDILRHAGCRIIYPWNLFDIGQGDSSLAAKLIRREMADL